MKIKKSELKNIVENVVKKTITEALTEKQELNESKEQQYPDITTLGDGTYEGMLWGHCFLYNGEKYYTQHGIRNKFPMYFTVVVNGGEVVDMDQKEPYQRQSLVKYFN